MSEKPSLPTEWETDDEPAQTESRPPAELTSDMLISEALERYLALNTRIRSRRTVVSYETIIKLFKSDMGGQTTVAMLTDDTLPHCKSRRLARR